jgi:hypothetical protein
MTEGKKPEADIRDEFSAFGDNLKKALNAAWQSEERVKAQQEIETGINQLGKALNDFATSFSASEAGQKVKEEVDEFSERLRSGEVEAKARQELVKVLKTLNTELGKVADRFAEEGDSPEA